MSADKRERDPAPPPPEGGDAADEEKKVAEPDILRELAAMSLAESEDWWKHSEDQSDENVWKPHAKATAFAHALLACEPEDLGHGVQLLRVNVDWLNNEQYHPWTFSRECTRRLARIIMADDGLKKFLLIGNPGIGKSRFLWELLRLLLLRGRLPSCS